MFNVYAYMVTKNEADRYFLAAMNSLRDAVDGLFVYDDQSDDGTRELLRNHRVPHIIRPSGRPSFMESEGLFRQDAWDRMEAMFEPRLGDWIFSLDADEQLRTRTHLRDLARRAQEAGHDALRLHIHEMWAEGQIRTDGFWRQTEGVRFCAWKPNGKFKTHHNNEQKTPLLMGGGSVPAYVENPSGTILADILHFGYFNPAERQAKMERYQAHRASGHNPRHIRSIITKPMLAPLPEMV